jgi:hypothetical protein
METSSVTDSLPTSRLHFLAGDDLHQIPAPVEWVPCTVEVLIPASDLSRTELRVQGALQRPYVTYVDGKARIFALWDRRGPGRYNVSLRVGEETSEETVRISPRKISQKGFECLLDDLDRHLPAAIAIGLARTGGLAGIEVRSLQARTVEEDLHRLETAVRGGAAPGLCDLLPTIAARPHQTFVAEHPWRTAAAARRPHPSKLPAALGRHNNIEKERTLKSVLDTSVRASFDVYENRLLRCFVDAVTGRLRMLSIHHQRQVRQLADELLSEVETIVRRCAFLGEVRDSRGVPTRLTTVLQHRPEYRAAFSAYKAFIESVRVELHQEERSSPLQNLPYLYELWASLSVIAALLSVATDLGFKVLRQQVVLRHPTGLWVRGLSSGTTALELKHPASGTRVQVVPQLAYTRCSKPFHSVSFDQIPDVSIQVDSPSGKTRVYLFDPKYKLVTEETAGMIIDGTPKKADIDKMHAYRDAIRFNDGSPAVEYAAILYPGSTFTYGDSLEAIGANPDNPDGLRRALENRFRIWLIA